MLRRKRSGALIVGGARFEAGTAGEIELDAGHSYAGTPVRIPVRIVRGAVPGPRLALLAGLRGDEGGAMQAVREALGRIDPRRLRGDLLAVPTANLVAMAQPHPSLRLRRSFPGDARGGAAARHAHVIHHEVLRNVEWAVVLGAGPSRRYLLPHVRADVDHPDVERLARGLRISPVIHGAPLPGTLVAAAARVGCAAVEYEMGRMAGLERTSIDAAVRAIEAMLATLGMLEEAEGPAKVELIRHADWLRASAGGLLELRVHPGQLVREGEPLADVISPTSGNRQTETAPAAGLVLGTTARTVANAGTPIVWLGRGVRRFPVPHRPARPLVGWSEWVTLPELGVGRLKAKIDTGARTCALHVSAIRPLGTDARGRALAEIDIPLGTRSRLANPVTARVVLLETIAVRDSGGHLEERPLIETTLELGGRKRRVRVTLTYRGDMRFPMLIGRTGLDRDFLIDAGARYLVGRQRS